MRIVVDGSRLGQAPAEDREHFRDLFRTLLAKGPGHTYAVSAWPESACGDAAAFLSPLPAHAASWSVELSGVRGGRRGGSPERAGPGTLVYFPLGAPPRSEPSGPPGAPALVSAGGVEDARAELAAIERISRRFETWIQVWTRSAGDRLARLGFPAERIVAVPPPAGAPEAWDLDELRGGGTEELSIAVSPHGLRLSEFAGALRALRREAKERARTVSALVLGGPYLGLRLCARLFGRDAVRWADGRSRSERVSLLAGARALLAGRGDRRSWFWIGEAISRGVPVLAPSEPDLSEILGEAALYYPAARRRRIPAGIWRWFLSEATARILSRRAFDRARSLSWEVYASRVLDLFARIARRDAWPAGGIPNSVA